MTYQNQNQLAQKLADLTKQMSVAGIKRTEFRTKSGSETFNKMYRYTAVFAFKSRERAAYFKLNCTHNCSFLDLVEAIELV